ncbi:MAG: tRNA (adenosine(37)-N6)-threonylcarbamoyltransferase complex transferase subunit TsaD [Ignavibacteria bacterium GWA2_55_11]|nr:MAG: tRNA (adenosine(37)-N6)-threonylcarbamoyltransferase complex transferase subunit TsaD [Ignavibacteria bacterium GWA2_55_11]OGU43392.1 MAG: tRNA (adenosine(37)-N6)-threonylcarbamoyltransferase complex transferase subunit TsaD [Ignavibacteria bacterium GWC2_56_12]OGU62564.1 MAG: tRNA (adenosine(37)-N6)-threonylcarbamoyltransferase complex transferase subunit TsaD [Ignavibacteria bacterium RIFCSPHIGHO2_02_FULL_56_12]OGU69786.1 MAG: tRNA (adenosine(37)-N6)-threonylcarbamoyltransferase comple
MTLLGIETSCDETSAAVLTDGVLLSNVTAAQLFHAEHGGVVPELASRAHQRMIVPVVDDALRKAGVQRAQLDGVAAVNGPGLVGSILVGLSFGKSLAYALGKPFVGVNHMEAHILSNLLESRKPSFPFMNLTVSGGHTQLVLVKAPFDYVMLGETSDDAAGEAFDKVAKMLGLEYPGGPAVDKRARLGDPKAVRFPRPALDHPGYAFSFSGLKTSVLYYIRDAHFDFASPDTTFVNDVCASFQAAVIDVLVGKLFQAAEEHGVKDVCIAGGVSANSGLRERAKTEADRRGFRLFVPRMEFCTDNGAMVAMAGFLRLNGGRTSSLEVSAEPNLALTAS